MREIGIDQRKVGMVRPMLEQQLTHLHQHLNTARSQVESTDQLLTARFGSAMKMQRHGSALVAHIGCDCFVDPTEIRPEPLRQRFEKVKLSWLVQRLPSRQDLARQRDARGFATAGEQSLASSSKIAIRQLVVPTHATEQLPSTVCDGLQKVGKERIALHNAGPITLSGNQVAISGTKQRMMMARNIAMT